MEALYTLNSPPVVSFIFLGTPKGTLTQVASLRNTRGRRLLAGEVDGDALPGLPGSSASASLGYWGLRAYRALGNPKP